MKKIVVLFLTISTLVFNSCSKDDAPTSQQSVEEKTVVKVKFYREKGDVIANQTICLFGALDGLGTKNFMPSKAINKAVTNADGIASFDLEVTNNETTFNFGVFDDIPNVIGSGSTTIKKGETKTLEIKKIIDIIAPD